MLGGCNSCPRPLWHSFWSDNFAGAPARSPPLSPVIIPPEKLATKLPEDSPSPGEYYSVFKSRWKLSEVVRFLGFISGDSVASLGKIAFADLSIRMRDFDAFSFIGRSLGVESFSVAGVPRILPDCDQEIIFCAHSSFSS